jgi:hypothetical protein
MQFAKIMDDFFTARWRTDLPCAKAQVDSGPPGPSRSPARS